jgi:hypothetical protein
MTNALANKRTSSVNTGDDGGRRSPRPVSDSDTAPGRPGRRRASQIDRERARIRYVVICMRSLIGALDDSRELGAIVRSRARPLDLGP